VEGSSGTRSRRADGALHGPAARRRRLRIGADGLAGRHADRAITDALRRLDHAIPHRLGLDEIAWLVREYGESAALAPKQALTRSSCTATTDDVLQWFLSPRTNRRDDRYGGGIDGRRRLLREVARRSAGT